MFCRYSETEVLEMYIFIGGHGTEQWDLPIYNFLQGQDLIYKIWKNDAFLDHHASRSSRKNQTVQFF